MDKEKIKRIVGKVCRIALFALVALFALALIVSTVINLGWIAVALWGGIILFILLLIGALAWDN